jgi:tRNA uridine 5-carboxymethylaminomethyl modification enzyme
MKTGTPPRVDGRTLNYEAMEIQPGDENPSRFSYTETSPLVNQLPCHITYTSQEVHDILRTGFDRSPMFNGRIRGLGPRYCPSIEDKIDRFSDKDRHQLFVEPEGRTTCEVYVNGFSSSLPEDVQYKAISKIAGFEKVKMFRPGYAIEYDFFPPTQLSLSLETHLLKGLFFAGQINGTTGYEEAASQGLMAGINAHLSVVEKDPFILKRSDAYIGVLIDDLVTKGTQEPYRMFTSRAEYRVLLRQDNADIRLTPLAVELGMNYMEDRIKKVEDKVADAKKITRFLNDCSVEPDQINGLLEEKGNYKAEAVEQAEINMKYAGYMAKEQEMVDKMSRLEMLKLSESFAYHSLTSLSAEAREKLTRMKPMTIGQASRISGVSPADISVLLIHLGR